VDALPIWGDVCRLSPSDRGAGAVLILMCDCYVLSDGSQSSILLPSGSLSHAKFP
jgi:hypothetical protein